jgi:Abortive infection C-terminus
MPVRISRRSQLAFAEFASASSTINQIARAFEGEGFFADPSQADVGGARRTTCAEYQNRIDPRADGAQRNLLNVYLEALESWTRESDRSLSPSALVVIRSLRRDGIPIDDAGHLTGPLPPPGLELADLDRVSDPGVLDEYLERMRTNIDRDTPAVIGAAKDLVESTCKLILDDRGIPYAAAAPLLDLYRAVALELRLSRDSVPANAKGSQAAQRALQGLVTTVQNLAELRNAIGVGHGRPQRVPALERHARLAMGASSTVADFLLSTWYARRDAHDG